VRDSRVAIVTGAGRGIGAATARLLGNAGYAVCVNYRSDAASANKVVEELKGAGAKAIAVKADVSHEEDVVRMFEAVDRELGTPSALVNNAGILFQQMRVADMDAARINATLPRGRAPDVDTAWRAGRLYRERFVRGRAHRFTGRVCRLRGIERGGRCVDPRPGR